MLFSLRPETTRGTLFRKKAEAPPQGKSNLWQTGFGKVWFVKHDIYWCIIENHDMYIREVMI